VVQRNYERSGPDSLWDGEGAYVMLPGLKRHRILAGLTQEELAKRVGMHRLSIVKLESTKRPARPRTLKRLSEALSIDPRDLVDQRDPVQ
jgi:transcriptional regulator with XRE-family HTH domain